MKFFTGKIRRKRLLLPAVALALVPLAIPTPAQALVNGIIGPSGTAVLYSDCREYQIAYSLGISNQTTYWNLNFKLLGPDGINEGSEYIYSSSYPSHGSVGLQLCGDDMPGTYTVQAYGNYDDASGDDLAYSIAPITFEARLPQTTTSLKKTRVAGDVYRFKATVKDERPNGYFGTEYADVALQQLQNGRWRNMRGLTLGTDSHGRASIRLAHSPGHPYKIRAVVGTTDSYTGSQSRPITL